MTYRCGRCGELGHNRRRCTAAVATPPRRNRALTPIQAWAQGMARYAVSAGKLPRKPCEVCGSPRAQAHHDDYLKPRAVRWLCVSHHRAWHREHGPGANHQAPIPYGRFSLWFPDGAVPEDDVHWRARVWNARGI